jgi:Domain of unknown function (DUF222)
VSLGLFPDPGPDGEEPGGCPVPPAAGEGGPIGQGLYICTPPGQLTLAGFAQNGEADTMAPGPLLATIAEYAARHDGSRPADEFAPDELAFELHLTPQSAKEQMGYASTVARRLPRSLAALAAGQIHPVHLRIIAEETSVLSDADAATADAVLAQTAPGQTFGEVRRTAHKLILKLDPDAARKRKEAARGQAHVRPFREQSGNAGMVARELPSDEVLASSLGDLAGGTRSGEINLLRRV